MLDYGIQDRVATITMDDGKANALSPVMLGEINAALDSAEADEAFAVVLAGREGRFSGGFDLGVLAGGGAEAVGMLRGGFELAERLLSLPRPVVVACTGHALAMGCFLLCSGDYRVGAEGDFKIQANEVKIGLPVPYAAVAMMRHRLSPSALDRAVGLAEAFDPSQAIAAGFLDRIVPPAEVIAVAQQVARSFADLDAAAHTASKLRARKELLPAVRSGIETEFAQAI